MWYHISVQGNKGQSMFWTNKEILHAIDLLGVYSHLHKVDVLAYQFLSNHYHLIVACDKPTDFMHGFRISYSKYFNNKYNTSGSVGKHHYSCGVISNRTKLEDRLIYVLRNSVKHGIEEHPYCDPYNSAQYYFLKERNMYEPEKLRIAGKKYTLNNSNYYIPEHFLLDSGGHIYPRSFLNYKAVENVFKLYSNFLQKISTPTENEVIANNGKPPTPKKIKINDLLLSEKIVELIKPRTILSLDIDEVVSLCRKFTKSRSVSVRQLSRVFGIPETSLRRLLST